MSCGCNRLIWQGATPALSPERLVEELKRLSPALRFTGRKEHADREDPAPPKEEGGKEGLQNAVLRLMGGDAVTLDWLREELEGAGISCGLPQLAGLLMELTLEGSCVQEGNRFRRSTPQDVFL